jgi:site-specific recombinase XerD
MELSFTDYLLQVKQLHTGNVRYTVSLVHSYHAWLGIHNISIETATYKTLLDYIGYLQQAGKSKLNINTHLRAISTYYRYKCLPDIANHVRIRGVTMQQPLYISEDDLNILFTAFKETYVINHRSHYSKTDCLILGLIIYQAADIKDIFNVLLKDINLQNGNIYLPSGLRFKNCRILKLEAQQILAFKDYMDYYRGNTHYKQLPLQNVLGVYKEEKLFTPNADSLQRLRDQIKALSKKVKQVGLTVNITIDNLHILRKSRIALWIKQHGIRKAQYLAGYRSIISTERYGLYDVASLQEQIQLFHPLH